MSEYGLLAFGCSGDLELSVGEPLEETEHWLLEIDLGLVSLQCCVRHLAIFAELEQFLGTFRVPDQNQHNSLEIGFYDQQTVVVHLDCEFVDRCFIVVSSSMEARFEIILAGRNFFDFQKACAKIVDELKEC